MALNQTNKLVWIVETIYRAHKISFEELNRRWMVYHYSLRNRRRYLSIHR
ncbi:hypothetical protein [Prevotella sp.]|nr:hypothetical protein [Prevotella sp.]